MVESGFLERRRKEIRTGEQTVPLAYAELRDAAGDQLGEATYDFIRAGAGREDTKRANTDAFQDVRIVHRVLRDISNRSLRTELFGTEFSAPVLLSPIGGQQRYHDDGERATARAAGNLGIPMTVSTPSSIPLEDVSPVSAEQRNFFQLYWPSEWEIAESLINRAEAAGYEAIVLTLDFQLARWAPRKLRHSTGLRSFDYPNFQSDPVVREKANEAATPVDDFIHESPALEKDRSLTWEDLDMLREWTDLPIVLKGILAVEDARRAAEWGADGIVISNHGGRQIDGQVSPLVQLPKIADAVGTKTELVLDSGIRTGADVFKALALGADAVGIGRPFLYGLTVGGERGVYETLLNILAELESVLGLSGYTAVSDIDREAVIEGRSTGVIPSAPIGNEHGEGFQRD